MATTTDTLRLYSVRTGAEDEGDHRNWVYIDVAAAKDKYDEQVARQSKVKRFSKTNPDYVFLTEYSLGSDSLNECKNILVWYRQ